MARLYVFRSARAALLLFVFAAIALVSASSLPRTAHAAGEPLAVLAAVKGKVDVAPARGGPPQRGTFGRPLERGDKVTVGPSSAATVFFNDGNVIELAEKSVVTIGGRVGAAKTSAGPAAGLPSEVFSQVSKFAVGGSRQAGLYVQAPTRGAEPDVPFLILSPRKSAVLTDRPAFAWRAVEGATRYRVTLSSADSGELWKRESTTQSLEYPADAPAIAPGSECLWEVEALSDLKTLRRESSVFQVMSAEQGAKVRANLERIRESAGGPETPAARFMAGSYLSGLGLYHDAAENFGALCKLSPHSAAPHEALGNVYTKVGLMDLANLELQQALDLSREP